MKGKPGLDDALEQQLRSQVPTTRAEPGNRSYTLHRDRLNPATFVFVET